MTQSNQNWSRIWQVIANAAAEIEKIARENANPEMSNISTSNRENQDERLAYSVLEAAKLVGKSHSYSGDAWRPEKIKAIELSGRILISRKEMDRFLKSGRKP